MITVDPRRVVRALVLAIWTAVFAWLWIDGATLYVGPRTSWVVPFGTIALALCTALVALGVVGQGGARRPSLRELAGYAVLLAPVVAVAVVDSPQLGANVANRKAGVELTVDELPAGNGALDLMSFVVASQDPGVAKRLGLDHGRRRVAFPGILTKRDAAAIDVTRFKIYCCAADAIPYTAKVEDPRGLTADFAINEWVYVRGRVDRSADGALTVRADHVEAVDPPLDPYL